MSEERFFSQVKSTMEHYAPEAPAEVYSGMRKKLWWNGFTKLSVTRFNMWYVLLFLGIGGGALAYNNTCKAPANAGASHSITPVVQPTVEKTTVVETEPVKAEEPVAPAKVETATAMPAAAEPATPVKKSSSVSQKAKKVEAKTPKAETTEVAVPAESVETSTETPSADPVKEEAPKKKHKKLVLDIFKDNSKDSNEGEN